MATPSCKGNWEGEYFGFVYSVAEENEGERVHTAVLGKSVYICHSTPNSSLIVSNGDPTKYLYSTL